MAIGTPALLGAVSSNDNTQQTLVVSLSPSIAAGDHVWVHVVADDALTGVGVTDAGSNAYTQVGTSQGVPATNGIQQCIFQAHATAIAASVTLDKGLAGNRPLNVQVAKATGIASSSALDQLITALFTNGTSHATGSTPATTQADELALLFDAVSENVTITPDGAYTSLGPIGGDFGGGNGTPKGVISYRILSATGVQSATTTLSGAAGEAITLATFKAAASAASIVSPLQTFGPSYAAHRAASI